MNGGVIDCTNIEILISKIAGMPKPVKEGQKPDLPGLLPLPPSNDTCVSSPKSIEVWVIGIPTPAHHSSKVHEETTA